MRPAAITTSLVFVTALVGTCFGQATKSETKPDFTGTWEVDLARNGGAASHKPAIPPMQIKITHGDPEFKIRRKVIIDDQIQETELIYFTDGRGEINLGPDCLGQRTTGSRPKQPATTTSKTSWSGNKIVTRSQCGSRSTQEIKETVEWRLSPNGRTLTQTATVEFLTGELAFTVGGQECLQTGFKVRVRMQEALGMIECRGLRIN